MTAKGGTAYVLQASGFDSLDPANNYMTRSQEATRLIYRTLTFIRDTPGEEPSIQPDLAEALGTPSDEGRTWTYRLREGLKYEDGRPITAQDIKYGVMRSFDRDVFPSGATWMPDLLANTTGFESPYATPEKDLSSVETPDDRTLVFHFAGPQADADWVMSMPYTSPVPKDKDTKEAYADRPIASGPYKIERYQPDSSLVLIRNENWDPATDPNRPAYPDRFEFELNVDGTAASDRLIKSDGRDAFAVPSEVLLVVADYARAQDPAVKPRFVNGPGPCVDYLSMNTQSITDPDVRHAIALAIDRQAIQDAYGGDITGALADSVIPPDVPGYVAPDLGLTPGGNPEEARKLLQGKSVPTLHLAVPDSPPGTMEKKVALIEANLTGVGLDVVVDRHTDEELSSVFDGVTGWDIDPSGVWCYDWPTAASMVMPLFGPDTDGTSWGPNNPGKFFEAKFSHQLQDLRSSTEDSSAIAKQVVDVANEIQTTAWPLVPTVNENDPEVVGANVTNVGISPIYSQVDLNLSLIHI